MSENKVIAKDSFRKEAFGILIILLCEFIFGIYTTLYVHFPEAASSKQLWRFSSTVPILNIHMILGLLITVGLIQFFVRSLIKKSKKWIIISTVSSVGVIASTIGGLQFIPTQSDLYSFIMSLGFAVALGSLVWGMFTSN